MQFSQSAILIQPLLLVGAVRKYLVYMQGYVSTRFNGAMQKLSLVVV